MKLWNLLFVLKGQYKFDKNFTEKAALSAQQGFWRTIQSFRTAFLKFFLAFSSSFPQIFSNFVLDQLVGTNSIRFHKKPSLVSTMVVSKPILFHKQIFFFSKFFDLDFELWIFGTNFLFCSDAGRNHKPDTISQKKWTCNL